MGRPLANDSRDTRRAILGAAIDLFAEHGYGGSSIRAIARAAGVRESALYYYFPSKEALFRALLEDIAATRGEETEEQLAASEGQTFEEVLRSLVESLMARLSDARQRKLWRIFTVEQQRFAAEAPLTRRLFDRPRRGMIALLDRLRQRGDLRDDLSPEFVVAQVFGPVLLFMHGPMHGGKGPIGMSRARFLDEHVAFLAEALAPRRRRRA